MRKIIKKRKKNLKTVKAQCVDISRKKEGFKQYKLPFHSAAKSDCDDNSLTTTI